MNKIVYKTIAITLLVYSNFTYGEEFCKKYKSKNILFCIDFEKNKTGEYTKNSIYNDWEKLIFYGNNEKRASIVKEKNNTLLEVTYPENSYGSSETGVTWVMKLPEKHDRLILEYKVKFSDGFIFSKEKVGGKLPGLSGGYNNSAGIIPSGKDGWSSRFMWGKEGRGLLYLYYPDMHSLKYNSFSNLHAPRINIFSNKYFTSSTEEPCVSGWPRPLGSEIKFLAGKFHTIKQEIVMNKTNSDALGSRDGVARVWLDNSLVVSCENIRYRDIDTLKIDSLFFSTFLGGNSLSSSSYRVTQKIFFDDFLVKK